MRTYAYVRLNSELEIDTPKFYSFFHENGFNVSKDRIFFEIVLPNKPLRYRDKIKNMIDYSLEKNDLLVVKGLSDLGSNFNEILYITKKIFEKGIRLVCIDFSNNEIYGDLRIFFLHFIMLVSEFENLICHNSSGVNVGGVLRKVGRPELLTIQQKIEVIDLYKKGCSVYALSKKFCVSRSVIIRILKMIE
ncbi:recombinase family protein [Acinetobacter junii]|uniref:recombinase family protein n=1 Tax=Acinetobacter junii TaxID=40215 RepID=UPI00301650D5